MQPFPARERPRFAPVFARLEADSEARFGFAGARIEPIGYEERPFSWICRAAVTRDGSATPALHLFIKIFKPKEPGSDIDLRDRVAKDYAITCEIHSFMAAWPTLGSVRPVACYDDALTIVTEQADGLTLLDRLQTDAAWFPRAVKIRELEAAMDSVGQWVSRFQGFRPDDRRLSGRDVTEYVDVRLRRLVEHRVMAPAMRERLLGHLADLAARVAPDDWREVAVHADLAPANVLVAPERIVLLDFAMATRGTKLHDISRLYMQTDLLRAKPQFRRAVISTLQAALLRGFDPALSADDPLFRLLSMLHHVNHLGTLALRREPLLPRLVSLRAIAMHRRWIRRELERGAQ